MIRYVVRRLAGAVPLLIGISLVSFTIVHLAPGDPSSLLLDPRFSPVESARIRASLGLDRPLHVQYLLWLGRLAHGDLGRSFSDGRPVTEKIIERLPATLTLTLSALGLSLLASIPLGTLAAVRPGSSWDRFCSVFALAGYSVPSFWLGLMLVALFSLRLGLLPSYGMSTLGEPFSIADRLRHLLLPAISLSCGGTAALARFVRSSAREALRQDYIRTARAKGLPEKVVLYRHALRNSLIPVITLLGLQLPGLFEGAVITENIFAWPGMGRLGVQAVFQRDYNLLLGINILSAALVVTGNILADVAYALVDPRVRHD